MTSLWYVESLTTFFFIYFLVLASGSSVEAWANSRSITKRFMNGQALVTELDFSVTH